MTGEFDKAWDGGVIFGLDLLPFPPPTLQTWHDQHAHKHTKTRTTTTTTVAQTEVSQSRLKCLGVMME